MKWLRMVVGRVCGESPLTEGRGLKSVTPCGVSAGRCVAPHGGAWIEIILPGIDRPGAVVAPHGGAWIEMVNRACASS